MVTEEEKVILRKVLLPLKTLVRRNSDWGPDPLICRSCYQWGKFKRNGNDQYNDFALVDHKDDCELAKALALL